MPTNVVISPQLHQTLLVYTQWLNDWYEVDWRPMPEGYPGEWAGPRPYSVDSFTVHRPEAGLYGEWQQLASWDTGWYDCYAFAVTDGDEGGGHVLTAWFNHRGKDMHGEPYGGELAHLTQEFDTQVQFVVQEGQFVNTPNQEGK